MLPTNLGAIATKAVTKLSPDAAILLRSEKKINSGTDEFITINKLR